tara:strand:- start:3320 stop:3775 length:456 start_codon:yes stop_codon:yes gene_type:complete
VSIVELAKIEAEVMYKPAVFGSTGTTFPGMGESGGPTVFPSPPTFSPGALPSWASEGDPAFSPGALPSWASEGDPAFSPGALPSWASEGDPAFSREMREHLPTDWRGTSPGAPGIRPSDTPTSARQPGVSDGSSTTSALVRKMREWRDGGS